MPRSYDPKKRLADMTVGELEAMVAGAARKLLKWGLLIYLGIPAGIFLFIVLLGLCMTHIQPR